jgi:hypothetical protein
METKARMQTDEVSETQEQERIAPDWTESEWFEVWLKLARHELEPAQK